VQRDVRATQLRSRCLDSFLICLDQAGANNGIKFMRIRSQRVFKHAGDVKCCTFRCDHTLALESALPAETLYGTEGMEARRKYFHIVPLRETCGLAFLKLSFGSAVVLMYEILSRRARNLLYKQTQSNRNASNVPN
jgi:hypothetical protein